MIDDVTLVLRSPIKVADVALFPYIFLNVQKTKLNHKPLKSKDYLVDLE